MQQDNDVPAAAPSAVAWATVEADTDGNFSFADPEDAHAGTTAKIVDKTFTKRDEAEAVSSGELAELPV